MERDEATLMCPAQGMIPVQHLLDQGFGPPDSRQNAYFFDSGSRFERRGLDAAKPLGFLCQHSTSADSLPWPLN